MSADKVYQNVTVIVAVAANLAIGRDNTIPWHLRADLQYFKKMTMDKTIIMGRNTFASLGFRKLPGRTSVVVTSDPTLGDRYGVETFTSLADAIAAHRGEPEIMIIGGGRLYREAVVNYAARLLVTKVDTVVEDAQVFFPSFEFMNSVCSRVEQELKKATKEDGIERTLLLQTPGMSAEDKKNYLDAFSEPSEGCLLGAAVLGGHFGEGIDLTGDRLSGVIIVGVGLPKITPERQILSNYYSEKFGDGFAFAYRYPGWEKVLQAVGRVIRTEEDTGFALLIDERLDKPEYLTLYPENWRV